MDWTDIPYFTLSHYFSELPETLVCSEQTGNSRKDNKANLRQRNLLEFLVMVAQSLGFDSSKQSEAQKERKHSLAPPKI